MAQTRHIARATVSSVKLVCSNWYLLVSSGVVSEATSGGTMTVTASVSKDRVTWTPVTWGGSASASIADGEDAASDAVSIALSDGDDFWVRMWRSVSGGFIVYCENMENTSNFDITRVGTSVTDCTDGTSFTNNALGFTGGPTAILGLTTKPGVLLIGDSVAYGTGGNYDTSTTGDVGKFAPSIGASYGYIMGARATDSAADFVAGATKRIALQAYASHVVSDFGRNDLDDGRTAAQIKADITSIAGAFTIPVWWDTITPKSTSTDSWATTVNQTTVANNSVRIEVNSWLRAGQSFLGGCFDSCPGVENDAVNADGKYKASYTADGIHPNATGYAAIKSGGYIATGQLHR